MQELLKALSDCPLIASVQAADDSPVQHPETLGRLALASLNQGVKVLRLQGAATIAHIRTQTAAPIIGLIKRAYPDSEIYITATTKEIEEVAEAGANIVALDGTPRKRPNAETLQDLIGLAHAKNLLVLADIDSVESAKYAWQAGADMVSTTLAGYTDAPSSKGPDLELLRQIVHLGPTFAEGRIAEPWQVQAALQIGATGVIVGGALNDADKNTRRFLPSPTPTAPVGAVDIGGTWMRFGIFSPDWQLQHVERTPNPPDRKERIQWIKDRVKESKVGSLGVGTGGIVDPETGLVWTAKEYLMPDHIGLTFDEKTFGVPTYAHGDGHATAWGHACLPEFAGKRVATLALGTGVGCGFVQQGKIWAGRRGEYPRINDLPAPGGKSYEDLLGGFHITREPSEETKEHGRIALKGAVSALRDLYFPDEIIMAGTVGLSEWLREAVTEEGLKITPFGGDAGLYGAAALAIFREVR